MLHCPGSLSDLAHRADLTRSLLAMATDLVDRYPGNLRYYRSFKLYSRQLSQLKYRISVLKAKEKG